MTFLNFYIQPSLYLQATITILRPKQISGITLRLHGRMFRKLFLHSVTECGSKQRLKPRRRLFSALVRVSVHLTQGRRHLSTDTFATCESYREGPHRKDTNTIWKSIQTLCLIRHLMLVLFLLMFLTARTYTRSSLCRHLSGRYRHESGHALVRVHMDRRGCMMLGRRGTSVRRACRMRRW